MSVLDQAFIRAYGKDHPDTSDTRPDEQSVTSSGTEPVGQRERNDQVPQLAHDSDVNVNWYGDARWYRADQPTPVDSLHRAGPTETAADDAGQATPDIADAEHARQISGSEICEEAAADLAAELYGQLPARSQVIVDTSRLDDLMKPEDECGENEEDVADDNSERQPDEQEAAWVLPPVLQDSDSGEESYEETISGPPQIRVDAAGKSVPTPHVIAEIPARHTQLSGADVVLTSTAEEPSASGAVEHDSDAQAEPDLAKSLFNPCWEVDRFRWPALCERLTNEHGEPLSLIGDELLAQLANDTKMVAVTSCQGGEGCTTISLCLASRMAAKGARILLVDGNFESPSIAARLGVDVPHGWNDAIADRCPLSEAAILSVDDKLTLLPLKHIEHDSVASWSSPRAGQLLRFASNLFDLVLVDCGPLENRHSSTRLTDNFSLPQRALLVRDVRNTLLHDVHHVVRRLQTVGIETVGIAENFGEATDDWSIAQPNSVMKND